MLPMLLGAIGGPLLQGALTGTALGALTATQLGAGIAGLTSLVQGNDIGTAALDAFGGYGGAGAVGNLAKTGAAVAGAANPTVSTALQGAGNAVTNVPGAYLESAGALGKTTSFLPDAASAANAPFSFSNVGTGLKDLFTEGGAQRFADITGKSALSSVGVPAAGAAIGLAGAMAPKPQGAAPMSFGFGPFVPFSELRRRASEDRMGYAEGGDIKARDDDFSDEQKANAARVLRLIGSGVLGPLADSGGLISGLFRPFRTAVNRAASGVEDSFTPFSELRRQRASLNSYAEGGIAALNPMSGMFDARTNLPEYREPMGNFKKGGYLNGPGDGMSDDIPATIEGKQPARLADGEFVVPADVVSHLGNGSTKAGAKRLYAMMDKVRKARTGTEKQGKQINPNKYMPA